MDQSSCYYTWQHRKQVYKNLFQIHCFMNYCFQLSKITQKNGIMQIAPSMSLKNPTGWHSKIGFYLRFLTVSLTYLFWTRSETLVETKVVHQSSHQNRLQLAEVKSSFRDFQEKTGGPLPHEQTGECSKITKLIFCLGVKFLNSLQTPSWSID